MLHVKKKLINYARTFTAFDGICGAGVLFSKLKPNSRGVLQQPRIRGPADGLTSVAPGNVPADLDGDQRGGAGVVPGSWCEEQFVLVLADAGDRPHQEGLRGAGP